MLEADGKNYNVLIKEIDYDSMKNQVTEIDFQALVSGEKVHSVAEIVLLNHEKVMDLSLIHISAGISILRFRIPRRRQGYWNAASMKNIFPFRTTVICACITLTCLSERL